MSFTKLMFSRKFFLINLVLLGIMIGFIAAFALLGSRPAGNASALALADNRPGVDAGTALAHAEAVEAAFNYVAASVMPSIVELHVITSRESGLIDQLPWRFFFGDPDQNQDEKEARPELESESLGSGIIVRKTGETFYVLTNYHVVEGGIKITVKLFDEREYEGTMVGADTRKDLAIVSFNAKISDVNPVALGNSDSVKVGDWAIAIGSPFGLFSSVTTGIVSAIGRDGGPDGNINDFIQTDAAINRGNSGGALTNIRGEVIGINTWIASTTGGSVGIGFSIPINNAIKSMDDIISAGTVQYGWLGVLLVSPDKETLKEMGLDGQKGAFLGNAFMDGPAFRSGLLPGDMVTAIDGKSISNLDQLVRVVADLPVGKSSKFSIIRSGQKLDVQVVIDERNENIASDYSKLWPGLEIAVMDQEEARKNSVPAGEKAYRVTSVIAKSPAAAAGLKIGDIITGINSKAIANSGEFYRLLNSESQLQFTFYREGSKLLSLALLRK